MAAVARTTLTLERDLDFSRVVVWDALTDADLIGGWLADAEVEPEVGGRYDLEWRDVTLPATQGVIEAFVDAQLLRVRTDNAGVIELRLLDRADREGSVLRIRFLPGIERAFAARMRSLWSERLHRLDELLRGRPTDWRRLADGGPVPGDPGAGHPRRRPRA